METAIPCGRHQPVLFKVVMYRGRKVTRLERMERARIVIDLKPLGPSLFIGLIHIKSKPNRIRGVGVGIEGRADMKHVHVL